MSEVVGFATKEADGWCDTSIGRTIAHIAERCLHDRRGGVIRGIPGVGKTAVLRRMQQTPDQGFVIVVTLDPSCRSWTAGCRRALEEIDDWHKKHFDGEAPRPARTHDAAVRLARTLRLVSQDGACPTLLVIDEAQEASGEQLNVYRGLWERSRTWEFGGLGVLLVGNHTFFNTKKGGLDLADFGPLLHRFNENFDIPALPPADIEAFLDSRRIFDQEARAYLRDGVARRAAIRGMEELINKARERCGARPVGIGDLGKAAGSMRFSFGGYTAAPR